MSFTSPLFSLHPPPPPDFSGPDYYYSDIQEIGFLAALTVIRFGGNCFAIKKGVAADLQLLNLTAHLLEQFYFRNLSPGHLWNLLEGYIPFIPGF